MAGDIAPQAAVAIASNALPERRAKKQKIPPGVSLISGAVAGAVEATATVCSPPTPRVNLW